MKLQTLQPGELVQLMQGRPMRLPSGYQPAAGGVDCLDAGNLTLDLLDGRSVEAVPVEAMPATGQGNEYRS